MVIDYHLPRRPPSTRTKLVSVLYDKETTVEVIVSKYLGWVSKHEYMIFEQNRYHSPVRRVASLVAKRGNPKYAWRVKQCFKELTLPFDLEYHNANLNANPKDETVAAQKTTNILLVTCTFDPRLADFKTAWRTIGSDWNRYLSNLRRHYGRIHTGRTWESMKNGYPHIHAILYFLDHTFPTFQKYSPKQKKNIWRIPNAERLKIMSYWKSRVVDVQGMINLRDGFRYLGKYVTKASDLSQNDPSDKGLRRWL